MDLIAATTKKTPSLSTKTGILYFHQRGKTKPQKKPKKPKKNNSRERYNFVYINTQKYLKNSTINKIRSNFYNLWRHKKRKKKERNNLSEDKIPSFKKDGFGYLS